MKLAERSPLKFDIVRGLSSLKPGVIVNSSDNAQHRFDICLKTLYESNRITSSDADAAKTQFSKMILSMMAKLKEFQESDDRLDVFWFSIIGNDQSYSALWKCFKVKYLFSNLFCFIPLSFNMPFYFSCYWYFLTVMQLWNEDSLLMKVY